MTEKTTPKPFTGRHMTLILVAFFGVVMTVNFTMARLASTTFGGKVVENSYVASQHYNEWLKRAEVQDGLGWDMVLSLDAQRHVQLAVHKDGAALTGLSVTASRSHPLGRATPQMLRFVATDDGALRSLETLPAGRWRIDLAIRHGADEARYRKDVQ